MLNDKKHNSLLAQGFRLDEPAKPADPMLESANGEPEAPPKKSFSDAMMEAVTQKTSQDERGAVAAAIIDWAQSDVPSSEDFDNLALSMAGIDDDEDDEDITDAQVDEYNRVLGMLADAAVALGATQEDVTALVDDDDDDAALSVADAINGSVDDEDEAIAVYAVSANDDAMLEANIKKVRDGKWTLVKKQPRPRRQTSAQRASLKKARLKSHTASANLARRKSMKIRRKRGL